MSSVCKFVHIFVHNLEHKKMEKGDKIIVSKRLEKIISISGWMVKHTSKIEKRGFAFSPIQTIQKKS